MNKILYIDINLDNIHKFIELIKTDYKIIDLENDNITNDDIYISNNQTNINNYSDFINFDFYYKESPKIINYTTKLINSEKPYVSVEGGIFKESHNETGVITFPQNLNVGIYDYKSIYNIWGLDIITNYKLIINPKFYYNGKMPIIEPNNKKGIFYLENNHPISNNGNIIDNYIGNVYYKVDELIISTYYDYKTTIVYENYQESELDVGIYYLIDKTVIIKPLITYLINSILNTEIKSITPTIIPQKNYIFSINNIQNITINKNTGELFFNKVDIGIYDIIINITLDDILLLTINHKLTVNPEFYYENNKPIVSYSFYKIEYDELPHNITIDENNIINPFEEI
jgi:hypothetical protein